MKIGLLECDHVTPAFRHIAGDYSDMFQALLPALAIEPYDVCNGHFPESVQACDAFICTGSRHSVYDDIGWIHQLKAFFRQMREARTPFVGLCFGHQMMAEALGGSVAKAEVGWCVGVHDFSVSETAGWMQPQQPAYKLLMLCQDQVVALPPDSRLLASAADCPVGMYQIGDHMLGIQAHPEFSKAYVEAVIRNRIQRIGEEKARVAIASLEQPLDTETIVQWILQFLKQQV
ncbi:MAG: hypothetical protein KDC66_15110 [Phaeodactylibacter sp.]|nr:hypothetical protein [Phaeodactylibacter sp.]MCB9273015.1 amidotransferase [Lewinellaceae bacterium]